MKNIIVPIDFSATAENAASYAFELATFYHADLHFYHAYEVYPPLSEYAYLASVQEMQSATDFEMEKFKEKIASKYSAKTNIITIAEGVNLLSGLNDYCNNVKPDLVVMGLSGKSAFTKLIVGSNTIQVVQHLSYPILVVPPKANFIPIRKLGFACDYNAVIASTPVGPIKKLVKDFNAELHILNVEASPNVPAKKIEESAYLAEFFNSLMPEYHTIQSSDITEGINYFADLTKVDWIVVIPKKHNLIDKLFKRSQTKELLYHTSVPILCIHEE